MDTTDNPAGTGETDKAPPGVAPETPSGRDKRGRFAKGAPSANPRGRPTESHELKVLAREKSPEAIKRLVFWLRSDDSTASIAAAKELLNRGYGRSEQGITLDATVTTTEPIWDEDDPNDTRPVVTDPVEASHIYIQMIRGKIPLGSVRFAPQQQAAAVYADMRIACDPKPPSDQEIEKIFDSSQGKPLSPIPPPGPQVLAAPPEAVQAPTSTAPPTAGPPERRSAAPAPREAAADPEDPSVVLVIEEPLRHFHEHRPKSDSSCPRCRQLWVTS